MPRLYGRYQVAEPPHALLTAHLHDGRTLQPVDHEPRVGVLDQEDLLAQGIYTDQLIAGAQRVDALGSCTANAFTSGVSNVLAVPEFLAATGASSVGDTKSAEEFAIRFYHGETTLTGNPGTEWPPTDCGSSGPFIVQYAQQLGLCSGAVIASGADNVVSLMQSDGLLMGSLWLNAWEEPDRLGFIDGNGRVSVLEQQLALGIAGGHETYLSAIEQLVVLPTGHVDPYRTILRGRNSWTAGWGDHGSYRVHLSTLVAFGGAIDLRQLRR